MPHFKIGDRVRLAKGTMLCSSRDELNGALGTVTDLVDDGTRLERITVAYDGGIELRGIYAGIFDRID
jgi:hypothetical protein